jgi:hypothetical protein
VIAALVAASSLVACRSNCATYVVTVVVEDQASGKLVCDASVRLITGAADAGGDAGQLVTPSSTPSDAEAAPSSSACQWDVVVGGGTYEIAATAPGFAAGVATLTLPTDECGTGAAPVTVLLVRP